MLTGNHELIIPLSFFTSYMFQLLLSGLVKGKTRTKCLFLTLTQSNKLYNCSPFRFHCIHVYSDQGRYEMRAEIWTFPPSSIATPPSQEAANKHTRIHFKVLLKNKLAVTSDVDYYEFKNRPCRNQKSLSSG